MSDVVTLQREGKTRKERTLHCHEMVYETAKKMAEELYDTVMTDNVVYAHWKQSYSNEFELFSSEPAAERFITLMAPKLIEQARQALAQTLRSTVLSEGQKALIHDALVKDWDLRRGRLPQKKRKLFKI